jgi:hypothetical protein
MRIVVSPWAKVWSLGFLLLAWTNAVQAADLASQIVKLTGARTKLAWVRSTPLGDPKEAKPKLAYSLMGFDTQANKEHEILSGLEGNVYPWITHDGARVIVPNPAKKESYVIDWNGENRKVLAQGEFSEVLCYTRDPNTQTEWVYMANPGKTPNNLGPVYRLQLDNPSVKELVWDKTEVRKFRASPDGKQAVGLFPHPNVGVAMLPNVSWQQYAKGCAIDMSPDGSGRFLHMTGRHREAVIYDQGGLNRRAVDLCQLPGIGGSEVWAPRWSNDVQYFTVSGPYPSGLASGRFDPGHIHLGKFNPGLTAVADWIQVTNKKDAKDICAYAWIERKTGPQAGPKQSRKPAAAPVETGGEWPSDRKDLVFLWETAELQKPRLVLDRKGEAIDGYELAQRGMGALFDKHYAMRLAGGSLAVAERADEVEEYLLAAWKKAGSLSVEAVITPAQTRQSGPARIVSIGADKEPENFYLGQEGNMLVLHVNTSASDPQGKNAPLKLCPLLAGKPCHVIVSYAPGRLVCYRDGKEVEATDKVEGDFRDWKNVHLVMGSTWDSKHPWAGTLEGIAMYARFIGSDEARLNYERYRNRIKGRKAVPRLEIEATLVERSIVPKPESLSPYTRALVVSEYEVGKVLVGKYGEKKIRVAHWGVLDRTNLPLAEAPLNQSRRIVLEPFAANPQIESEFLSDTLPASDVPLFYDVGPIELPAAAKGK